MGGISAFGGKVTGHVVDKLLGKVNSALLKTALSIPIKMAGEGLEEYVQEILEPVYRNIAFSENNEFRIGPKTR